MSAQLHKARAAAVRRALAASTVGTPFEPKLKLASSQADQYMAACVMERWLFNLFVAHLCVFVQSFYQGLQQREKQDEMWKGQPAIRAVLYYNSSAICQLVLSQAVLHCSAVYCWLGTVMMQAAQR